MISCSMIRAVFVRSRSEEEEEEEGEVEEEEEEEEEGGGGGENREGGGIQFYTFLFPDNNSCSYGYVGTYSQPEAAVGLFSAPVLLSCS